MENVPVSQDVQPTAWHFSLNHHGRGVCLSLLVVWPQVFISIEPISAFRCRDAGSSIDNVDAFLLLTAFLAKTV